jgi:hypothetical protein
VAASAALQAYYDDVGAGRLSEAWERLSPDTQAMWGSLETFAPPPHDMTLSSPVSERDLRCDWIAAAYDFDGADLSRAYMITASDDDAPLTPIHRPVVWIIAPLPDGHGASGRSGEPLRRPLPGVQTACDAGDSARERLCSRPPERE